MKYYPKYLVLFSILVVGVHVTAFKERQRFEKGTISMLKVAYPSPWVSIEPGLQHTLVGDLLLSNQFESLTGVSATGVTIPLAAKKWEISEDFKTFRFQIDTSRTFTDGTKLSAAHVKEAWQQALKKQPVSANPGVLGLFYRVEGFETFSETGDLSGLKVIDEETLELRLTMPMRTALENLMSSRFGIFKTSTDGNYIGTGQFQLNQTADNKVLLTPRKDANAQSDQSTKIPQIEARYLSYPESIQALLDGDVEAIAYTLAVAKIADQLLHPEVELVIGQEAAHVGIGLNSTQQSIFSQKQMRQAFQDLIFEVLQRDSGSLPSPKLFSQDLQFFLPLQAGRISPEEAQEIISQGKQHREELLRQATKRPLRVGYLPWQESFVDLLREVGLAIDPEAKPLDMGTYLKLLYSLEGPDLIIQNFGMSGSDPDGLYNKFGEHGGIKTPYVFSEPVAVLLEEGRSLTNAKAIDEHYQKVNRSLLSEVPMVHIGFARSVLAYRLDKMTLDTNLRFRGHGHLHGFRQR